jgi:hypothetical protein
MPLSQQTFQLFGEASCHGRVQLPWFHCSVTVVCNQQMDTYLGMTL